MTVPRPTIVLGSSAVDPLVGVGIAILAVLVLGAVAYAVRRSGRRMDAAMGRGGDDDSILCPRCHHYTDADARYCPECGKELA